MMTSDESRSFFRQAWEHHDVKALMACYADDCVVLSPIFSKLEAGTGSAVSSVGSIAIG